MKREEIPSYDVEYKEKCDNCLEEISCFTQQDRTPEYYTQVYIKCKCGDYQYFNLPVN